MENVTGFSGHRKAFIYTVNDDNTYHIQFADDNTNNIIKDVPAINLGSFGSGIFSRYHVGAPVWVGQSYYYQPLIIGYATPSQTIEQGNILLVNDIESPHGDPGELFLQSSSGAHIDLRTSGDIKVSNLKNDGVFLSDTHRSLLTTAYQQYTINDSGYTVEGRVRRFDPKYTPGSDPVFIDLLADPEADAFTLDVARDQTQKSLPMNRARGSVNVLRNPSFAEKREMILEFADSFFVRDTNTEVDLASEFPKIIQDMDRSIAKRRGYGEDEQNFDDLRHSSRTNLLRLDDNVVIERVQGTLVDIFGNVLDLNYNRLNLPKLTEKGKDAIQEAHDLLTRSVAYHFQVNSRNIISDTSTGSGKFTLDIDKQGLFKLNVPRSSASGTIPIISDFTSQAADMGSRIDIHNVDLSQSNIAAPTGGLVGTAFHDMTMAGDRLIRHSIKALNPIRVHNNTLGIQTNGDTPNIEFVVNSQYSSAIPTYTTTVSVMPDEPAISDTIDKSLVGGRSGLMNLEGSLEVSIGKDDVDGKSLLLDTAGAVISSVGMDSNGRSVISNTDGDVLLNIGDYVLDSNDVPIFNPGLLSIRVNLTDEKANGRLKVEEITDNKTRSDHIIYLGPKGIIISAGNGTSIAIRSSGDLNLEAAGTIDMKAKEIRVDAGYLRRISTKKGDI